MSHHRIDKPAYRRTGMLLTIRCPMIVIRLFLTILVVQASFWYVDHPSSVAAQQTVGKVVSVSAASFENPGVVAPDSIVAAFGAGLAPIVQVAETIPLPTVISNVTVEVNGRSTGLYFISPDQINYLLPQDLAEGTGQVLVKRNGQVVAAGEIEIRAGAPSIFMANPDAQGPPAANLLRLRPNNPVVEEPASQFDGTKVRFVPRMIDLDAPNEQVFLILYLTGTPKEPQPGDFRVLLGGNECQPEFMPYVGIAPGFAGLKQINLNLGGCVQRLREENPRANFTGMVSVALSDIKNGQTSNIIQLEFAPPDGAPPRITGLSKASVLAGDMLELQGSGLAETTEVYLTDGDGKRFNAQIEQPLTPTTVRVRVPFGAGTGSITAVTGRGESTFPLTMRTSVSGVIQIAELQPDGTYKRRGLRNASVRLMGQNSPPPAMTNDDGSFQIPDVSFPGGASTTVGLLSVDAAPAGLLNLKRTEKLQLFAGRDNEFPGYLELKAATGPTIPTGPGGLLPNQSVRVPVVNSARASEISGQNEDVIFEPNGSTVTFPDGSTVNALTVTALDPERPPADLPPGQFSSTIVQLTPIGAKISMGGKLTFPNTDQLPVGTTDATLYRFDQTPGSATLGQFVAAGGVTISSDGKRIETGPRAIIESTYYFVSVTRPLTAIYGSVKEADGQPARSAKVQIRGQSAFASTDANGGFQIVKVPVLGAETVIEVTYLRADGTVDRAERRGVTLRVGTTPISPPIVLPGQGQGIKPVILAPKSLVVEAGRTTDYTFLAYPRLANVTLQPLEVKGATFASITGVNNDRYVLRLAPGAGAAGNYTLAVTATDSDGLRTDETIALEVKASAVNAPVAVSQSVTTDEDQAVSITLSGNGGTQYRIVNAPQRGMLTGAAPNLVYTPSRGYNGADDFRFVVGNGSVESDPATVAIAVRPVGNAPILDVATGYKTNIEQLLRVVINGSDPDAGQTLTLTNSPLPAGAKIERATGTSWVLEWKPTAQQAGTYSVNLRLSDNGTPSLSNMKTITIVADVGTLACGSLVSGVIDAVAPVDEYRFEGRERQLVTLTLTNTSAPGSAFSPRLRLTSPSGITVGSLLQANAHQAVYTLPATGTYVARVSASDFSSTGSYNVGLECLVPLQSPDIVTLACGSFSPGTIQSPAEVDLFRFEGLAGQTVTLTLAHNSAPIGNFSAVLTVFSPTGTNVGINLYSNGQANYTLPAAGTYVIRVNASDLKSTGSYNIGLECLFPVQSPGSVALACGGLNSGTIEAAAEVDLFHFEGQRGQTVTLTLVNTSAPGSAFSPRLALISPSGAPYGSLLQANAHQAVYTLPATGTYVALVSATSFSSTGSYNVGLECLVPLQSPDIVTLACGSFSPGTIQSPAEVDLFRFEGLAGQTVTLRLAHNFVQGSNFSAVLTVFSPTGTNVGINLYSNNEANYTLPAAGTYVIRVSASDLKSTGSYNVNLQCL